MVEITQIERENLAVAFERAGHPHIAHWLRSMQGDDSTHTPALRALATQREAHEARIAELERERDAADLSRTVYARALEKMRIALVNVHDGMEDEGDRIYLGSTNHAEDLKAAWHAADALHWEVVLADTQPKTDAVKANLHLQSEVSTLTSANNDLLEALNAAARDLRSVYDAAKSGKPIVIMIGQWVRLDKYERAASAYKKHGGRG